MVVGIVESKYEATIIESKHTLPDENNGKIYIEEVRVRVK